MAAYLTRNPPVRDQWYAKRNRALTGCTVLHTAENPLDVIGDDSGAERIAEFIRTRTTPGNYHGIVDSDSRIHLTEYVHGAYHDGTGSNNFSLSICFACRTTDWSKMDRATFDGFMQQGAEEFIEQQRYQKSVGAPYTRLRLISKDQSDRGESGFLGHGHRDPVRRSDPGTRAPYLFPWAAWFDACRTALGKAPDLADHPDAPTKKEDIMTPDQEKLLRSVADAVGAGGIGDVATNPTDVSKRRDVSLAYLAAYARFDALRAHQAAAALQGQVAALTAAVSALARGEADSEELRAFISAEVDRAREAFREAIVEGYDAEVKLSPRQ